MIQNKDFNTLFKMKKICKKCSYWESREEDEGFCYFYFALTLKIANCHYWKDKSEL